MLQVGDWPQMVHKLLQDDAQRCCCLRNKSQAGDYTCKLQSTSFDISASQTWLGCGIWPHICIHASPLLRQQDNSKLYFLCFLFFLLSHALRDGGHVVSLKAPYLQLRKHCQLRCFDSIVSDTLGTTSVANSSS